GIAANPAGETAIPVHVLTDREERDKQRAIPSKKKAVTVLTPLTPYPNMRRLLAQPALQTAIQPFLNPRTAWQGPLREEGLRSELADRVIQQAELVREIPKAAATFFKSAASLEETSSTDYPASKPARSFSELHLNTLLGDANDQNPLPLKVKQYLAVAPLQLGAVYDADYEAQMVKAIETEAAYQERGYLTLYHAAPREVAVLYDLYTAVTQHLSPSATQYKLRWGEMPFKHFQNIETFMEHFREVGGGTIDNYTQDFADMGASANLPIFGSPQHHTSASYYLFGQNTSSRVVDPFAEGSILQKGFMVSGLSLEETQLLLKRVRSLVEQTRERGGMLCQLHIPNGEVQAATYAAVSMGREYRKEDKPITLLDAKAAFEANPNDIQLREELQARIFLHPEAMAGTVVIRYDHHPATKAAEKAYQEKLKESATFIAKQMLAKGETEVVYLQAPAMRRIYNALVKELTGKDNEADPAKAANQFERFFVSKQTYNLERFLAQHPQFFTQPANQEKLCSLMHSAEEWMMLMAMLPNHVPQVVELMVKATNKSFAETFNVASLIELLVRINSDHQKVALLQMIQDQLPLMIHSGEDFEQIMSYIFGSGAERIVFESMRLHLPLLIHDSGDLYRICCSLTPNDCEIFCRDCIKPGLLETITTIQWFANSLSLLMFGDQRFNAVSNLLQTVWPRLIKSSDDLEL
ncbi:MAG: ankyrin repeat protein and NUDIX protein interaction protein, partial [uncultured bacterium]